MPDRPTPSDTIRCGDGQGSLTELEPGVWRTRIHLGNDAITGKMVQPSRRFRGSRAAVERELARFRAELEEAGLRPLAMSTRVTQRGHRAPRRRERPARTGTRRIRQSQYERHIAPGLGRLPGGKLTAQGMRTYYRRLPEEAQL